MEEARFELRHGTQDKEVFDQVVVGNQYRLPDSLPKDSVVIDIGANIGAFAAACLLRGAGTVACFEPSKDNFGQLCANTKYWPGQVPCFNIGVWRSDCDQEIAFSRGGGTAAGCCFPTNLEVPEFKYERVNAIGLDQIIMVCTNDGDRRIQLLKIDAEFSEYPILYTCTKLGLVDEIIGETHEFTDQLALSDNYFKHAKYKNTISEIVRFLEDNGFTVATERESFENQTNTLFFATRTPEQK